MESKLQLTEQEIRRIIQTLLSEADGITPGAYPTEALENYVPPQRQDEKDTDYLTRVSREADLTYVTEDDAKLIATLKIDPNVNDDLAKSILQNQRVLAKATCRAAMIVAALTAGYALVKKDPDDICLVGFGKNGRSADAAFRQIKSLLGNDNDKLYDFVFNDKLIASDLQSEVIYKKLASAALGNLTPAEIAAMTTQLDDQEVKTQSISVDGSNAIPIIFDSFSRVMSSQATSEDLASFKSTVQTLDSDSMLMTRLMAAQFANTHFNYKMFGPGGTDLPDFDRNMGIWFDERKLGWITSADDFKLKWSAKFRDKIEKAQVWGTSTSDKIKSITTPASEQNESIIITRNGKILMTEAQMRRVIRTLLEATPVGGRRGRAPRVPDPVTRLPPVGADPDVAVRAPDEAAPPRPPEEGGPEGGPRAGSSGTPAPRPIPISDPAASEGLSVINLRRSWLKDDFGIDKSLKSLPEEVKAKSLPFEDPTEIEAASDYVIPAKIRQTYERPDTSDLDIGNPDFQPEGPVTFAIARLFFTADSSLGDEANILNKIEEEDPNIAPVFDAARKLQEDVRDALRNEAKLSNVIALIQSTPLATTDIQYDGRTVRVDLDKFKRSLMYDAFVAYGYANLLRLLPAGDADISRAAQVIDNAPIDLLQTAPLQNLAVSSYILKSIQDVSSAADDSIPTPESFAGTEPGSAELEWQLTDSVVRRAASVQAASNVDNIQIRRLMLFTDVVDRAPTSPDPSDIEAVSKLILKIRKDIADRTPTTRGRARPRPTLTQADQAFLAFMSDPSNYQKVTRDTLQVKRRFYQREAGRVFKARYGNENPTLFSDSKLITLADLSNEYPARRRAAVLSSFSEDFGSGRRTDAQRQADNNIHGLVADYLSLAWQRRVAQEVGEINVDDSAKAVLWSNQAVDPDNIIDMPVLNSPEEFEQSVSMAGIREAKVKRGSFLTFGFEKDIGVRQRFIDSFVSEHVTATQKFGLAVLGTLNTALTMPGMTVIFTTIAAAGSAGTPGGASVGAAVTGGIVGAVVGAATTRLRKAVQVNYATEKGVPATVAGEDAAKMRETIKNATSPVASFGAVAAVVAALAYLVQVLEINPAGELTSWTITTDRYLRNSDDAASDAELANQLVEKMSKGLTVLANYELEQGNTDAHNIHIKVANAFGELARTPLKAVGDTAKQKFLAALA